MKGNKILYSNVGSICFGLVGHHQVDQEYKIVAYQAERYRTDAGIKYSLYLDFTVISLYETERRRLALKCYSVSQVEETIYVYIGVQEKGSFMRKFC